MYISKILSFEQEAKEAYVYASDGSYSILCFAYPVNEVFVGQTISDIDTFLCKNIEISEDQIFQIKKLPSFFEHKIIAQVVSNGKRLVRVGDLYISLDKPIPADIPDGAFVSFSAVRFDASCVENSCVEKKQERKTGWIHLFNSKR